MENIAVRGSIFYTTDDPSKNPNTVKYLEDGVLLIDNGRIQDVLDGNRFCGDLSASRRVFEYPNCLICPGFIDSHVHFAQTRIMASPASGLLEWLERHTFPEEMRFVDKAYATQVAGEFLDLTARNGTTSALVYPTIHYDSTDCFFEQSANRGLRMVCGKVLMDRNAPDGLRDTVEDGIQDTERLINKWHGSGRLTYAITPRFAGTSTPQQLTSCGILLERYSDVLLHTHLSETHEEIEWTLGLFSGFEDYLAVYEHYGLVSERSVFAHCIHLSNQECRRMSDAGASALLCPTSNLFLGSGLVHSKRLATKGIATALATDVGGGTSFSMLQTMQDLYKVGQLVNEALSAVELFYLATLGGARALHIDQFVGSFESGKEADFVVLDAGKSEYMKQRLAKSRDVEDQLFLFAITGSDSNVRETWSMGRKIYSRDE